MIKTIIIDAKKEERDRVDSFLSASSDIKVVANGKDGYDALKLSDCLKPDVAIIGNDLDLIESEDIPPLVRFRSPGTAIIILIDKYNDRQLKKAVLNMFSGFLCRDTDMEKLPEILRCVSAGGCYINPVLAARILRIFSAEKKDRKTADSQTAYEIPRREDPVGLLSKTELQILSFVGKGFGSDEIAKKLNMAVGTIRNNISAIMRKIGLNNRSQMASYAINFGLVLSSRTIYNGSKTGR